MLIDYQLLIDEAMLGIVKRVLHNTSSKGLVGDQSFYISFKTDHSGVTLSRGIREKYPKEITIVLQHQFRDLRVLEDTFSVNITFSGIPETIMVPFAALTSFIDPIANFSLQFKKNRETTEVEVKALDLDSDDETKIKHIRLKLPTKEKDSAKKKLKQAGEVIAIDKFRKK